MTETDVKLAIIIVHYNTSEDLARLLTSLTEYPPACSHRVVVVDNASHDPGLASVLERFPDCEWVMNAENVGYARGCNLGLAHVSADFALILNPDIVVEPDALDRLVAFAGTHPRAGIIGPQLLNEDGSIQDSCRRFYTFRTLFMRRTILGRLFPDSPTVAHHLMRDFDHAGSRPVDWVLGGCLLARREAVAAVGPMDERFFLYFEDVDWCYRMWQAGWEVHYNAEARFVHRHRRESAKGVRSRSFWLHLGSLISFYEKWGMLVYLLKKWRGPLAVLALWGLDMVAATVSFHGAYLLRVLAGDMFPEPLYPLAEYRPLFLFALLLTTVTFGLMGRYRRARLRSRPGFWQHLKQVGAVSLLLLAASYLGRQQVVSRAVLLVFVTLLTLTTFGGEALYRRLLRRMERGYLTLERSLLVGPRRLIAAWLTACRDPRSAGIDPVGWAGGAEEQVLFATPGEPLGTASGTREIPWLGGWADLSALVDRFRVSQVVFWESPGPDERRRKAIAALRRQHVTLRWQGEEAWLLAAGARTEFFGGEMGGVVEPATGAALANLGLRLGSAVAGLLLAVLALPAWLWLKVVRIPRAAARVERVDAVTSAGHTVHLSLAVDRAGRVLSLPWQWPLVGALLRGDLDLWGLRPRPVGEPKAAGAALSWWEIWRSEVRRPGLCGPWSLAEADTASRGARRGPLGRVPTLLVALWCRPGGWERVAGEAPPAPTRGDGVEGEPT